MTKAVNKYVLSIAFLHRQLFPLLIVTILCDVTHATTIYDQGVFNPKANFDSSRRRSMNVMNQTKQLSKKLYHKRDNSAITRFKNNSTSTDIWLKKFIAAHRSLQTNPLLMDTASITEYLNKHESHSNYTLPEETFKPMDPNYDYKFGYDFGADKEDFDSYFNETFNTTNLNPSHFLYEALAGRYDFNEFMYGNENNTLFPTQTSYRGEKGDKTNNPTVLHQNITKSSFNR